MSQYRGRRRSFRNTILLMLVLVLGLAVALVWSNTVLQTEEFTFVSSRLPAAFDGYRVVVLSDLHSAVFGEENRDLLQRVADAKALLDHGFANYALTKAAEGEVLPPVPVTMGSQTAVQPVAEERTRA
mgnify:CR=1 FL=1